MTDYQRINVELLHLYSHRLTDYKELVRQNVFDLEYIVCSLQHIVFILSRYPSQTEECILLQNQYQELIDPLLEKLLQEGQTFDKDNTYIRRKHRGKLTTKENHIRK